MVSTFTAVFVLSLFEFHFLVTATPIRFQRRIAQNIVESTAQWEEACLSARGGVRCNPVSVRAFTTLLAPAGDCEQQDAADAMVDLAKTLNNDAEMVRLAQLFVQQPRNTPASLQVPYCQQLPKNAELNGLFHCQFASSLNTSVSSDDPTAGGNVPLPLGVVAVNPPGSCPAKLDGPVPDGVQLNTLVNVPGALSTTGGLDEHQIPPPRLPVGDNSQSSGGRSVRVPLDGTPTHSERAYMFATCQIPNIFAFAKKILTFTHTLMLN